MRAHVLVYRCHLPAVSSHGGWGQGSFLGECLFVKSINLIHEGSILITKSSCKGSYLLILLHWGLAFNTSIQAIILFKMLWIKRQSDSFLFLSTNEDFCCNIVGMYHSKDLSPSLSFCDRVCRFLLTQSTVSNKSLPLLPSPTLGVLLRMQLSIWTNFQGTCPRILEFTWKLVSCFLITSERMYLYLD